MKPLTEHLLRKRERNELEDAITREQRMLEHPKIEDKTQVKKNIAQLKGRLERFSPEPLAAAERDKLSKLEKQLAVKIQDGMPSDETMRKNPVGAIGQHTRWERAKKKLIKMWKNVRIQLNPDNDDADLANVEQLRNPGQMDRLRTDAQISGHMSYGDIDPALWPFEPPKETALEQAKRAEQERVAKSLEEADAAVAGVPVPRPQAIAAKIRKPLSDVHRQALRDRLAHAREMRRVKKMAAQHGEQDVQVETAPVGNDADAATVSA